MAKTPVAKRKSAPAAETSPAKAIKALEKKHNGEELHQELSQQLLGCPYDALNPVQKSVIDLIVTEAPSGLHPRLHVEDRRRFHERLADQVAAIGGSWGFIIGFGLFLAVWMAWNVLSSKHWSFDPYPFIFLNLMLSTLAAIQAPVIMMSQNRAADRDREAAEHDYLVNLRAELEIMHLHDKVDVIRERSIVELLKKQNEAIRLLKLQVERLADRK